VIDKPKEGGNLEKKKSACNCWGSLSRQEKRNWRGKESPSWKRTAQNMGGVVGGVGGVWGGGGVGWRREEEASQYEIEIPSGKTRVEKKRDYRKSKSYSKKQKRSSEKKLETIIVNILSQEPRQKEPEEEL